jgi:hypothetical protein
MNVGVYIYAGHSCQNCERAWGGPVHFVKRGRYVIKLWEEKAFYLAFRDILKPEMVDNNF